MLETIITAVIASLASGGLLNWYFKKRIEHKYKLKLKDHEANLKRDYDVQVEKLKAELARQHLRFSLVFERTEQIIADTYRKLLALKNASDDYTRQKNPDSTKRESLKSIYWTRVEEFQTHYYPNKIYIPKDTMLQIEAFLKMSIAATLQFSLAIQDAALPNRTDESYGKVFDDFFTTSDQLPKLLGLLEDNFQTILGFPIQKQSEHKK
jgi:hypothetical protein